MPNKDVLHIVHSAAKVLCMNTIFMQRMDTFVLIGLL